MYTIQKSQVIGFKVPKLAKELMLVKQSPGIPVVFVKFIKLFLAYFY